MSETKPVTPSQHAADLRNRAADLLGQDRTYLLWLASEWEKTAAREPLPPSRRAPSGGTAARRTGRTAAQRAE